MPCVTALNWEIHTACPSIRIGNPLRWVASQGTWDLHQAISPADDADNVSVDIRGELADVLVFQRQFDFFEDQQMLRTMRSWGSPMVFDIDDDFINVPDNHPIKDVLLGLRKNLMNLLNICDVTVTATPELAELYRPFCQRVEVIPNSVDPLIWNRKCRWSSENNVVIGYAGTESHRPDLEIIEDTLIDVLNARPQTQLKLWGCSTAKLLAHERCTFVNSYRLSYADYVADFQTHDIDIAVAPLIDTPFNRAKSSIKWMEYSIGSVPGIYSRLPAYERRVQDNENGRLCAADPSAWSEALYELVDDTKKRQTLGHNARKQVVLHACPEHPGQLWHTLLDDLHRHGRQPPKPAATTVIIPVYNRSDLTGPCLEAVTAHTPTDTEIIVLDNASTDDTPQLLDSWRDRVTVIRNAWNLGYAIANNQAAALARGTRLVMLNNDTEVQPGWLDALHARADRSDAGIVGARLMYPDNTLQHGGIALYPDDDRPHVIYCGIDGNDPHFDMLAGRARPFQMVSAACWLVSRDLFDSLNGFDEAYINGYEDLDFCLRSGEIGATVWYEPAAVVIHHESQTAGRSDHIDINEERLFSAWRGRWQHDLDLYLTEDGMRWTGEGFEPLENSTLDNNFRVLFKRFPELATFVRLHREGWNARHLSSNEEQNSLQITINGSIQWIHSRKNPHREAERLATQILADQHEGPLKIAGFGMGWHLEALRKQAPDRIVTVAIVDLAVLRRAMALRDLTALLNDPHIELVNALEPPFFVLPAYRVREQAPTGERIAQNPLQ